MSWYGDSEKGCPLPGIPCPKCSKFACVYDGNYFCTACDWALPDHWEKKLIKSLRFWYGAAYLTVMRETDREPDERTMEQIMTGRG